MILLLCFYCLTVRWDPYVGWPNYSCQLMIPGLLLSMKCRDRVVAKIRIEAITTIKRGWRKVPSCRAGPRMECYTMLLYCYVRNCSLSNCRREGERERDAEANGFECICSACSLSWLFKNDRIARPWHGRPDRPAQWGRLLLSKGRPRSESRTLGLPSRFAERAERTQLYLQLVSRQTACCQCSFTSLLKHFFCRT